MTTKINSYWNYSLFYTQIIESEDSSESSDHESPVAAPTLIPKQLEALLRGLGANPNMTSLESVAQQLAAFGSISQPAPGFNPFYPAGKFAIESFYWNRIYKKIFLRSLSIFDTIVALITIAAIECGILVDSSRRSCCFI